MHKQDQLEIQGPHLLDTEKEIEKMHLPIYLDTSFLIIGGLSINTML